MSSNHQLELWSQSVSETENVTRYDNMCGKAYATLCAESSYKLLWDLKNSVIFGYSHLLTLWTFFKLPVFTERRKHTCFRWGRFRKRAGIPGETVAFPTLPHRRVVFGLDSGTKHNRPQALDRMGYGVAWVLTTLAQNLTFQTISQHFRHFSHISDN